MTEQPATPAPPEIPDRELVPEFSWWTNREGTETFCVVKILSYDGSLDRVWMLQKPSTQPFTLGGEEMKRAIREGRLARMK